MDAGTAALLALDAKLQFAVDNILRSEDDWDHDVDEDAQIAQQEYKGGDDRDYDYDLPSLRWGR